MVFCQLSCVTQCCLGIPAFCPALGSLPPCLPTPLSYLVLSMKNQWLKGLCSAWNQEWLQQKCLPAKCVPCAVPPPCVPPPTPRFFGDWLNWLCSGWNQGSAQAALERCLDAICKELQAEGVRGTQGGHAAFQPPRLRVHAPCVPVLDNHLCLNQFYTLYTQGCTLDGGTTVRAIHKALHAFMLTGTT